MSEEKNEKDAIQISFPTKEVAVVTIKSQPLGVLRFGVKRALKEAVLKLELDRSIKSVVLTGFEKSFSVGSDISDFSTEIGWLLENDYVEADLNAALENSRLPIIAAVNGFAFGGGSVLALACDIRMAAGSAKFGFPEVRVGAFASGSGTQRLPSLIGRGRALDLLMTGRTIGAEEALRIGLVEYVIPDDDLQGDAIELASLISQNAARAVSASKYCVRVGLQDGVEAGLAAEREMRIQTGRGPDALEGRNAFLEKRKPKFVE